MYIVELTYPGTWIDSPDGDWASAISRQLSDAEAPLAETAIALSWFEREQQAMFEARRLLPPELPTGTEPDTNMANQQFIARLTDELGPGPYNSAEFLAMQFCFELEAKCEEWKLGTLPRSYQERLVFMHAKSFLLALDRIDRLFGVVAGTPSIPDAVAQAKHAFDAAVPTLRGVRNSVAHHEDRSRGLGRGGKPLSLKAVDNPLARASGGVLILESLIGNRFGSTMADGEYGEVSVTSATLASANQLVQASIDAFRWKGSPRHWPT